MRCNGLLTAPDASSTFVNCLPFSDEKTTAITFEMFDVFPQHLIPFAR